MKIKKFLLILISIFIGCGGLLFGCTTPPMELSILYNDEKVDGLVFNLSSNLILNDDDNYDEEETDDVELTTNEEANKVITDTARIFVKADKVNDIFKQKLNINYNKNVVSVKEIKTYENAYEFEIKVLKVENSYIKFISKDEKSSVKLDIIVLQDCEKIEKNTQSQNYVVFGENKVLNNAIINFTPSTTTDKEITYELSESYNGVSIENNEIKFDKNATNITNTNGEVVNQIKVTAKHKNYKEEDENYANFIVENIVFDVLDKVESLGAFTNDGSYKDSLKFASNITNDDNFSSIELNIKKELRKTFVNLDSNYSLEYSLLTDDDLVIIDDRYIDEFKLIVSQNFRSGKNVLIIKAINKIQPSYTSNELRIPIEVRTYPTYILVNGEKNPNDVVLYDNGQAAKIKIEVGSNNSFNTNFKINEITGNIILKYANGKVISNGTELISGSEIYATINKENNNAITSLEDASFKINSVVEDVNLNKIVNIKIVQNLTSVNIVSDSNATTLIENNEFSMLKLNTNGSFMESTFTISNENNIYIPTFTISVENENILACTQIYYSSSISKFILKAKTSGKTNVNISFDNGLEKSITINVYSPVNDIKIDLDDETISHSVGKVESENNSLTNIALKLGYSAQLLILPYDVNGNLITDYCILDTNYDLTNNDNFIAISNTTNIISSLKSSNDTSVTITAKFTVFDFKGKRKEISKTFECEVFVSLNDFQILQNGRNVEEEGISLYSKDSLGYENYSESLAQFSVDILPSGANRIGESIQAQLNFDFTKVQVLSDGTSISSENKITINKNPNNNYVLNFEATGLVESEYQVGTITFSITEFNIVYTKKVRVTIKKAIKPETILLDNIELVSNLDGKSSDYLYLNLDKKESININPRVYPLNSHNTNYVIKIENSTTGFDPISFNNGAISAKNAGECDLVLIPKGIITGYNNETKEYLYDEINDSNKIRRIHIFVADGVTVAYQIRNKADLLDLCSPVIFGNGKDEDEINEYKEIQSNKYNKKYVLTNDIDLSGENILPIGIFRIDDRGIKNILIPFTGEFSGKFKVNNIENYYSITGISVNVNENDYIYDLVDLENNKIENDKYLSYVGLFANNKGKLYDLNLIYSKVNVISSILPVINLNNNGLNIDTSLKGELYFGGVSAVNEGEITNCNVTLYNANIVSFLGNSFIGGISGTNIGDAGLIENSFVKGNLNVINGYALQQDENINQTRTNMYVGGFSGINEAIISGNYLSFNEEILNKNNINSTLNLTALNNDNIVEVLGTSAYGLIAGKNLGEIKDLTTYGRIYAYNNIGGITGINEYGTIENCITASSLYGNSNVGGISGSCNNGSIQYCAVLILDDGEVFSLNQQNAKIIGESFVGGIYGNGSSTLENSYIRSFAVKNDNYYDIYVQKNGYGYLFVGDNIENDSSNAVLGTNFSDNVKAVFHSGDNLQENKSLTTGLTSLGILAPTSITAKVNPSTIFAGSTVGYNRFINCSDLDNNLIILYLYNNDYSKYNSYLSNYIFKLIYNYQNNNIDDRQKINFNKIVSSNPNVLSVDENGNFKVNSCGIATITITSLLNKEASCEINVKIINAIEKANIFKDTLRKEELKDVLYVEKDTSLNIYLNSQLIQEDVFVQYTYNDNYIEINDNNENNLYNSLNSQVIKGKVNGTTKVSVTFKVKYNNKFYDLPYNISFNAVVKSGLKYLYSDFENATITKNSHLNLNITALTDIPATTNIVVEQLVYNNETKSYENDNNEYLNWGLNTKVLQDEKEFSLDLSVVKTFTKVQLKIYITDEFVSLDDIKQNESKYNNHIKLIEISLAQNNIINADLEFYADGEISKDANGDDVYNQDELESEFIKIGKIGILKINVYPLKNLKEENKITLTYSNSNNYNLTLKQVEKIGNGYQNISTDKIISRGLELDNSSLFTNNSNENYLYVRVLTDSGIIEGSEFNLMLNISGFDYYFTKKLTSKLTQNLEISYSGAVLNNDGELEGVYAKGVSDSQIVSLTVSKLNEFRHYYQFSNSLNLSLNLINTTVINEDSVKYDYIINGLNVSGTNAKLYFYLDKVTNGKTERYKTLTLKLNVVDFVVTGVSLENVTDNYLTKPIGTSYPLKVKLSTINNGDTEILNKIASIEEKISKENIFKYNNENLSVKAYTNFEIEKPDYYFIKPINVVRDYSFSYNFNISYKNDTTSSSSLTDLFVITTEESGVKNFIDSDKYYSTNFNANFGVNFYLQTDINNPVPVYTQEEFENMQTNANYILLNDIELTNYTPFKADFSSFDGNGYKVTIKSLNINLDEIVDEYNFGLFTEISENTKVLNLNIKLDFDYTDSNDVIENQNILNLQNISTLYFGVVAAKNNGLIYNCYVEPFKINGFNDILTINVTNILNDEQTLAYIGGFVGENNGIITNSRSELKFSTNKGFIAGFVCVNNGTISSSYYKNALIKNFGEDETTSAMAGFVYLNSNDANILFSYVEGETLNVDNVGRFGSDTLFAPFCLTSPTNIGGFIFNNAGNIEDCYSNLSITSNSYSGGFVYQNSGKLNRCYSATINEKEDNIAHAPFIATKVQINENTMKELITNCFYLKSSDTSVINDNLVTGLTFNEFNDEYYLTEFVLDDKTIWEFNSNRLPSLYEANNIAYSQRRLYSAKENADGSILYSYIYLTYYAGHELNPIVISTEEEFLSYFTVESYNSNRNNYNYRLINNIDFSEYFNLPTTSYTFSGKLDGNGLRINNLSISAESGFNKNSFGLFSRIEGVSEKAVVKNLTISPKEVYANNVENVGTLAGVVENANIINVKVDSNTVVVQGRNVVGGIVGKVLKDSSLINLTSNVSTNANFSLYSLTGKGKVNIYLQDDDINKQISYAGNIAGIIDVNSTTNNNERVRNITVEEGTKAIGEFTGLAFGLICENSGIDNIKVYVNNSSYLNALYSAGVVVGENRGYISRVYTTLNRNSNNLSLFKNSTKAIGGVVGFNNGGTIVNSILNVNAIGEKALVAGGVAGVTAGGSFSSIYSNIKISAKQIAGGVVGYASRKNILDDSIENAENTIKTNNIIFISNCVIYNSDNTYIDAAIVGGIVGGVHNTISLDGDELISTTKYSYITYNNFYKTQEVEYIVTNNEGQSSYKGSLADYGANNIEDFILQDNNKGRVFVENSVATENSNKDLINLTDAKPCGTQIKSLESNCFTNFSRKVFDFTDLNNPSLKSLNNINTKKLVGLGTIADPYLLDSVSGLNQLSSLVKNGAGRIYINLVENIEATGKNVISIGDSSSKFIGILNGNNKSINGLTYFNTNQYATQTFFGLFGYVGEGGVVRDLNVSANFVINYGSNINYTGIIAGYNQGYISNCSTYGGIIGVLQNIQSEDAISYVGTIAGINGGRIGYGIVDCKNYATIYLTITDEENTNGTNVENVIITAGLITGANINGASVTRSYNNAVSTDINSGVGDYTLIVLNGNKEGCITYLGKIFGQKSNSSNVEEFYGQLNYEDNIYAYANQIVLNKDE